MLVQYEETKEAILRSLLDCKRDGIDKLCSWLCETDFFTAPASTKFHGAYAGGLAKHSLNVFNFMGIMCNHLPGIFDIPHQSVKVCSLLHDVCKINCYEPSNRWVKDMNGKWESIPCWTWNEKYPFGAHGAKSVYLISKFIKLSDVEASAITAHMGAYENEKMCTQVYEKNKLAWLLHVADEYATYYLD